MQVSDAPRVSRVLVSQREDGVSMLWKSVRGLWGDLMVGVECSRAFFSTTVMSKSMRISKDLCGCCHDRPTCPPDAFISGGLLKGWLRARSFDAVRLRGLMQFDGDAATIFPSLRRRRLGALLTMAVATYLPSWSS